VAAAFGLIIASGAIVGMLVWVAMRPAPPRVSRLQVAPPGTAALTISGVDRDLAITPDGSRLVYVGNDGTQLFVRALDALTPVAVFTGQPHGLFVSPDGRWIGFGDGSGGLKKVAVTGGPAVTLTTIATTFGATWGPDDTIILATDRFAADRGWRWDAHDPHAARSRAGRSRSLLARDAARRPCRAVHDHGADGRP
jgi:hypothetical protein